MKIFNGAKKNHDFWLECRYNLLNADAMTHYVLQTFIYFKKRKVSLNSAIKIYNIAILDPHQNGCG